MKSTGLSGELSQLRICSAGIVVYLNYIFMSMNIELVLVPSVHMSFVTYFGGAYMELVSTLSYVVLSRNVSLLC
jgi:hypothetical protein